MADDGDKTEEPTPKKLEQARKKGQVALSRDLLAGTVFIVIFVTLSLSATSWLMSLYGYFRQAFTLVSMPGQSTTAHLAMGLAALVDVLTVPMAAGFVAAIFIGFAQTGGLFSLEALKIDPQRLMPNFKKIFGMQTWVEVIKGFVKVSLASAAAWAAFEPLIGTFTNLTGVKMMGVLTILGYGADKVGNNLILVVGVIAGADLLWQRHSFMKKMRMSHDEIKREYKDSEGDPHHKQERKQFHKELLEQRMVNDVKKANFVVVNPTHIAVAIRYDKDTDAAPVVLAKGERLLAERIKQAAREAGVPIFRDVSLARALKDVEEGDEVPEALYEAIAEILRHVYGQQQPAPPPVAPGSGSTMGMAPPGAGGAAPAPGAGRAPGAANPPAPTSDAPKGTWRRA